jgi:hypothetical protein
MVIVYFSLGIDAGSYVVGGVPLSWDFISLSFKHAIEYLVEALCYKPKDRGFDSR